MQPTREDCRVSTWVLAAAGQRGVRFDVLDPAAAAASHARWMARYKDPAVNPGFLSEGLNQHLGPTTCVECTEGARRVRPFLVGREVVAHFGRYAMPASDDPTVARFPDGAGLLDAYAGAAMNRPMYVTDPDATFLVCFNGEGWMDVYDAPAAWVLADIDREVKPDIVG